MSSDIRENAYSGVYSLSATTLRRRITGALQKTESEKAKAAVTFINQNTVYTYPTVNRLTNYLVGLVADPIWTRVPWEIGHEFLTSVTNISGPKVFLTYCY